MRANVAVNGRRSDRKARNPGDFNYVPDDCNYIQRGDSYYSEFYSPPYEDEDIENKESSIH